MLNNICPLCQIPYENEDIIVLNQISKEKLQIMKDVMEEKRQKRHGGKPFLAGENLGVLFPEPNLTIGSFAHVFFGLKKEFL